MHSSIKICTLSCQFSFISLQAAESKPPSKPVKKESKKEKKEMSLLDLDDCEFLLSLQAFCSEGEYKTKNADFSKAKSVDKDICKACDYF